MLVLGIALGYRTGTETRCVGSRCVKAGRKIKRKEENKNIMQEEARKRENAPKLEAKRFYARSNGRYLEKIKLRKTNMQKQKSETRRKKGRNKADHSRKRRQGSAASLCSECNLSLIHI